jgi:hypothetical protein
MYMADKLTEKAGHRNNFAVLMMLPVGIYGSDG